MHVRTAAGALLALVATGAAAHHAIVGKFDPAKTTTIEGVVTAVDWRNPHVHVFMNVGAGADMQNWAVELASPIILKRSGWSRDTLRPGDAVVVDGIVARNGTRQVWGESVRLAATGRRVLYAQDSPPPPPKTARPTPRWPDGQPMLGALDGNDGYWAYPTSTSLVEDGVEVAVDEFGLLKDIDDAPRVAPFQPWALGLYVHRQNRQLRDDPMFINCKPPGGVRYLQTSLGVQFLEDRARQRIFVLMGSGNHNYRIIYLDGREPVGNVRGDDNNPLYYGRSVGRWEGDTLVVETVGFNEDFWFSNGGLPHTDRLRLTERFSRPDADTLEYTVTVDDPGAYTRPWTASWELRWIGGEALPEYFCQDNRS
ncbi:MAG TPA: DUF6152 family protein [Gammaproteobacteria bacterium]